jgi:hypothetical protein
LQKACVTGGRVILHKANMKNGRIQWLI